MHSTSIGIFSASPGCLEAKEALKVNIHYESIDAFYRDLFAESMKVCCNNKEILNRKDRQLDVAKKKGWLSTFQSKRFLQNGWIWLEI